MQRAGWAQISKSILMAAVLGGAGLLVCGPLTTGTVAQNKTGVVDATKIKQSISLQTEDGFILRGTYYRASTEKESKDAAVVLLLHMKDGVRGVWEGENGVAAQLQQKGIAVVTVDLRNHGESRPEGVIGTGNANQGKKGKKEAGLSLKPVDFQKMLNLDLEAVKKFIFDEHQAGRLNMNKMGIVGAEMSATLAAAYTAIDWAKEPYEDGQPGFQTPRGQDIRAVVLISPEENYHGSGIKLSQVTATMRNPDNLISVLVCSGNDAKEKAQGEKVFDMVNPAVTGNKEKSRLNEGRMFHSALPARLNGTNLLGNNLEIERLIVNFFDKQLRPVNSAWKNRESKRVKKK